MKTPDQFPLRFHATLSLGLGNWLLSANRSQEDARQSARHFREFLASFGIAPGHPLAGFCKNHSIKTRIVAEGELFYVRVIIAPPFSIPDPQPPKNTPGPK